MRKISEPTQDERGNEVHPAYGMIKASRVTNSVGSVLFDSDIQHTHSVVLTVTRATRKRSLNRDWIHPDGKDLIEVEVSEAQWASFVSSMNTTGVPCTIRRTPDEVYVDGLPYSPRMQQSMQEVHDAAERTFSEIKEALAAYEEKKTAANLRNLHYTIENATANVDYTSKTLREHTENVVQRARADIEAMVTHKAVQLGLAPGDIDIPAITGQVEQATDDDGGVT